MQCEDMKCQGCNTLNVGLIVLEITDCSSHHNQGKKGNVQMKGQPVQVKAWVVKLTMKWILIPQVLQMCQWLVPQPLLTVFNFPLIIYLV